jgi:hypothetical protein
MSQARLLPLIRPRMLQWLGGYVDRGEILTGCDRYVVAPELGDNAGVRGALILAMQAAERAAFNPAAAAATSASGRNAGSSAESAPRSPASRSAS